MSRAELTKSERETYEALLLRRSEAASLGGRMTAAGDDEVAK